MSIIGKAILGSCIADLEKRINNCTDHAVASAGDKLIWALEEAQKKYEGSLDKTIDKLDAQGRKFFDNINNVVRDLDKYTAKNIKELHDIVDKVIGQLPFQKMQLIGVEGTVITRSSNANTFPVTLKGYFPEMGQNWPTLEVNGAVLDETQVSISTRLTRLAGNFFSYLGLASVFAGAGVCAKNKSSDGGYIILFGAACMTVKRLCFKSKDGNAGHITTRHITFDVPFDKLGPSKGIVDRVKGVVKFPREGWILNYSDDYPIRITVLPNSPGMITLDSTYHKLHDFAKESEILVSEVELHSSKTEHKGDQESRIFIQAPRGWKLDLTTKQIVVPKITEGKKYTLPKGINGKSYGCELITATQDRVEYKIWTKALGHKNSGWAVFRLECKAICSQSIQPNRNNSENIILKWGDSVVKDVPNQFKVTFKAFDGTSNEFVRQDFSNPYIEIRKSQDDKLEIKAKRLDEIY